MPEQEIAKSDKNKNDYKKSVSIRENRIRKNDIYVINDRFVTKEDYEKIKGDGR